MVGNPALPRSPRLLRERIAELSALHARARTDAGAAALLAEIREAQAALDAVATD